jgi:hypothetical protein
MGKQGEASIASLRLHLKMGVTLGYLFNLGVEKEEVL